LQFDTKCKIPSKEKNPPYRIKMGKLFLDDYSQILKNISKG